ncbi:Branched-chain-amino-acid aminotransferase, cytosolic [Cryptotermes secundus]|uniref:Branched-chain-amino-acid aminotransferase n=1 Tax=Cryptotermes secundus TaxID=105785 RepID=A0A2J7PYH4_9NEOP|nr:branched-chain-amino-acid aminotransferase, cytosolic isoform X1 [Cryptotermes secundus]PNF21393.1 Branched-chain-amino-acid aminotransferase, cytosolic [Cryptotermes secundus]
MVTLTRLARVLLRRKFLCRHVATYKVKPALSFSNEVQNTFKFADLSVHLASPEQLQQKPEVTALQFGKHFTDHMLKILYHESLGGWQRPEILPFENIVLHPAAKVLHYATELFEGMKAYRGVDGKIRIFRPEKNMERMNQSALRAGLPTFDGENFIKCLCQLLSIEQEWVPHSESSSLYIRPTLIGIDPSLGVAQCASALLYTILCPVGSYFSGTGEAAVSLLADPRFTRSWPGGCGDKKMGSNYAPTIHVQQEALGQGLQQVLWLYSDDHLITEVGTMNIFMFCINDSGERELITPPLDGLILPGITRASILELSREWNEFRVSERSIPMSEVVHLLSENRLLELFGAGTACVVSPVASISYRGETLHIPTERHKYPIYAKFRQTLTDIQYGRVSHPWAVPIDT